LLHNLPKVLQLPTSTNLQQLLLFIANFIEEPIYFNLFNLKGIASNNPSNLIYLSTAKLANLSAALLGTCFYYRH
jgi:hypothetical protein